METHTLRTRPLCPLQGSRRCGVRKPHTPRPRTPPACPHPQRLGRPRHSAPRPSSAPAQSWPLGQNPLRAAASEQVPCGAAAQAGHRGQRPRVRSPGRAFLRQVSTRPRHLQATGLSYEEETEQAPTSSQSLVCTRQTCDLVKRKRGGTVTLGGEQPAAVGHKQDADAGREAAAGGGSVPTPSRCCQSWTRWSCCCRTRRSCCC